MVTIRCTLCREKFKWDLESLGYPDDCPKCKQHIGHDRDDSDIVMPSIGRMRAAAVDDAFYRRIEAGSEVRAQAAADQLNVPVAEMSDLKITNLNPTRHPGDIAATWDHAAVARLGVRDESSLFKGSNGAEFGPQVQSGDFPNAGAHTRTSLQQYHQQLTGGAGVSDRPALEVLQPGYRIRG